MGGVKGRVEYTETDASAKSCCVSKLLVRLPLTFRGPIVDFPFLWPMYK